jgi:hypothetical protein
LLKKEKRKKKKEKRKKRILSFSGAKRGPLCPSSRAIIPNKAKYLIIYN